MKGGSIMIEETLNAAQTDALFSREAVLFGPYSEGVPAYRIAELFGEKVSAWAEGCMHYGGYLGSGKDANGYGSCTEDNPMINYFPKTGFQKIVGYHNYRVTVQRHRESAGGAVVDAIWKAREERLAAKDAEEERKHWEKREKRAAARKAKQEAAEKEKATA